MLLRSPRWVEQTAAIFADALDGYVRNNLYASDHRGLVVRYTRLPATYEARPLAEQLVWVQHPYLTGSSEDSSKPQAIFAASVKFSATSASTAEFNTVNRQPLLIDKVKPNQLVSQRLSRPVYLSAIEVSLSCEAADAEFRNSPPSLALEAQFFHHDPLVVPKWVRLTLLPAGHSDISWRYPGSLQEPNRAMTVVRLVFAGVARKIALCRFDLIV